MKHSSGLAVALTVFVTALSGCSVYNLPGSSGPSRRPAPSEPSEPEVVTPAPDDAPPSSPPVITSPDEPRPSSAPGSGSPNDSLVGRANAAAAEGDYERALALLERAQRIDPTDSGIYLALARTYAAKGDTDQAKATAERGLLYCRSTAQCDQLRAYIR